MRVLLVEDEPLLAAQVDRFLRDSDFAVDMASDGEVGLYHARQIAYAAAVVDLGLPKLGGLELISTLRAEDNRVPILILTARGSWQDKVAGLEAGGDDYLAKPFHMEELLARIKVLIRRSAGYASAMIERGPLRIDTRRREVHVAGQPVELTAFEYRLLEYLVLHPARAVSRMELADHLYAADVDPDSNVLEVMIGRLRRKLDPNGSLRPIRTQRGFGYRFELGDG